MFAVVVVCISPRDSAIYRERRTHNGVRKRTSSQDSAGQRMNNSKGIEHNSCSMRTAIESECGDDRKQKRAPQWSTRWPQSNDNISITSRDGYTSAKVEKKPWNERAICTFIRHALKPQLICLTSQSPSDSLPNRTERERERCLHCRNWIKYFICATFPEYFIAFWKKVEYIDGWS